MTKQKIYHFDVPVSGRETFSVIASSYKEALEKIDNDQYEVEPETMDIEWDFGLGHSADDHLPECYTVQDLNGDVND